MTALLDNRAQSQIAGATWRYIPGWWRTVSTASPELVAERLWAELAWNAAAGNRREYYCNDTGETYTYGQGKGERSYGAQPWHPLLKDAQRAAELETQTRQESVVINGYADANDHLGWHADDSPEMDDQRPICVISFGAERDIMFRPQVSRSGADPADAIERLRLGNGSLLIMAPGMQDTHHHRIPKAGRVVGKRVSMTFRGWILESAR